jgi:hypothetical protein
MIEYVTEEYLAYEVVHELIPVGWGYPTINTIFFEKMEHAVAARQALLLAEGTTHVMVKKTMKTRTTQREVPDEPTA